MKIFDGNIGRQGGFLIGAKRQLCPTGWKAGRAVRFAPVRGDDGDDRSFITRDFNGDWGKENGTIPFYRIFLKKVFPPSLIPLRQGYGGTGATTRQVDANQRDAGLD
jgi:hypothetical protein